MSDKDQQGVGITQGKEKLFVTIAKKDTGKSVFENMVSERIRTFDKKTDHFKGINKVFTSKIEEIPEEDSKYVDGSFDVSRFPNEYKAPVSSVKEQLSFMAMSAIEYVNTSLTIERTNASGLVKADLIVRGQTLGQFSSAELLSLRNFIREFKKVYSKIPTYDPNGSWKTEKTEDGWYQSEKITSAKGRQVKDWKIVAPANQYQKEAQVKDFTKELLLGNYDTVHYSTMFSPKEKNDLLQRTQELLVAIDVAIKQANDVKVVEADEAEKIMNFLHKGNI
jgi:hypothetical protein